MAGKRIRGAHASAAAADTSETTAVESRTVVGMDVARRAYDLYVSRGREDGHDVEDWLQAERELREGHV